MQSAPTLVISHFRAPSSSLARCVARPAHSLEPPPPPLYVVSALERTRGRTARRAPRGPARAAARRWRRRRSHRRECSPPPARRVLTGPEQGRAAAAALARADALAQPAHPRRRRGARAGRARAGLAGAARGQADGRGGDADGRGLRALAPQTRLCVRPRAPHCAPSADARPQAGGIRACRRRPTRARACARACARSARSSPSAWAAVCPARVRRAPAPAPTPGPPLAGQACPVGRAWLGHYLGRTTT
jgi:hypothetical protein